MKTIGIITYHHYYNYGTMLQAYALQKKIEKLGYAAELIDFKQNNEVSGLGLLKIRLKRISTYIRYYRKYFVLRKNQRQIQEKNKQFEEFYAANVPVSTEKYSDTLQLKKNPPIYDGYIVGSDQTWNPYVAKNPEAFYLTFVSDSRKKGTYAPSIGVNQLTSEQQEMFRARLADFAFISCREPTGANLLSAVLGRAVERVLDPTLLLGREEWSALSGKSENAPPYILTYFLGDVAFHRLFVDRLAEKTGLPVISIPISYMEMDSKKNEKKWVGPEGFLSLIRDAEYVCTDSFHGTMFSINFGVKFFSFCKRKDKSTGSDNSRLHSALELFGLSDRMVSASNMDRALEHRNDIDFDRVKHFLDEERKRSTAYLENMLKQITA